MQKENHFLSANFKKNYKNYIIQSMLGALCIFIIFIACHNIINGVFIVSFASTTFVVFSSPCSDSSSSRNIIGSYVIGIIVGIIFYLLNKSICGFNFQAFYLSSEVLCCVLAFWLTMFFTSAFDCKHAPAVAFSLSLVVGNVIYISAFIAVLGVLSLCLLKWILRKYLINLT